MKSVKSIVREGREAGKGRDPEDWYALLSAAALRRVIKHGSAPSAGKGENEGKREGKGQGGGKKENADCITRQLSPACQLHSSSENLDPDFALPDLSLRNTATKQKCHTGEN